jgi:hypothetical protein
MDRALHRDEDDLASVRRLSARAKAARRRKKHPAGSVVTLGGSRNRREDLASVFDRASCAHLWAPRHQRGAGRRSANAAPDERADRGRCHRSRRPATSASAACRASCRGRAVSRKAGAERWKITRAFGRSQRRATLRRRLAGPAFRCGGRHRRLDGAGRAAGIGAAPPARALVGRPHRGCSARTHRSSQGSSGLARRGERRAR